MTHPSTSAGPVNGKAAADAGIAAYNAKGYSFRLFGPPASPPGGP